MFNSNRLALPLISIVATLTMLGSSNEALALQRGDNNSQVRNLQSCLKRLGYFNGPVNGNFASMTEAAVRRFQRANRISAIGKVGPRTQAALQRRCGSGRARSGVSQNDCQRGLRYGCDGAAVRTLQRNLRTLRVYTGPITGRFRELTRDAVIRFQRREGINPIGIVGPRTREAIRVGLQGRFTPRIQPTLRDRICDLNRETITVGCSGEWVKLIQERLKNLGYFTGDATSYYGQITRNAVLRFQQVNGIPVSGDVDRRTWFAIDRGIQSTGTRPQDILKVGDRGSQVGNLQQQLKQLGYFFGNITNFYDSSTQDAVARFQQAYGLLVTGSVDRRTSEMIDRVWRNIPRRGRGGRRDPNFIPLQFGDENQRVKQVQEVLGRRGLLTVVPTGYFGDLTRNAVIAFQQFERLRPTGIVDEETWKRLGLRIAREKRYVVVIPLRDPDIYDRVLQVLPSARVEESRLGRYVNAGEYNERIEAQRRSELLRQRDFDARVEYF
ncbi:MAG: peptidoglycan-binding protein [Cyanobacteria bacterium P01_D01_bin.50]